MAQVDGVSLEELSRKWLSGLDISSHVAQCGRPSCSPGCGWQPLWHELLLPGLALLLLPCCCRRRRVARAPVGDWQVIGASEEKGVGPRHEVQAGRAVGRIESDGSGGS